MHGSVPGDDLKGVPQKDTEKKRRDAKRVVLAWKRAPTICSDRIVQGARSAVLAWKRAPAAGKKVPKKLLAKRRQKSIDS